jgi:hypothetical protein
MTIAPDGVTLLGLPGRYVVHRLPSDHAVAESIWSAADFVSVSRTADELSVVVREEVDMTASRTSDPMRAYRVAGTLDFSLIGVLSRLTDPLARAEVSVFVISTFDTDYLLVPGARVEEAEAAWTAAGIAIRRQ